MATISRRAFVSVGASAGLGAIALRRTFAEAPAVGPPETIGLRGTPAAGPVVTVDAKPAPILIDTARTAVIVCDMQNDFGSEGGMFHLAGIDISMIRSAVGPTARVLASARHAGIRAIYLKMGFRPDLSDAGAVDSPNRLKHLGLGGSERRYEHRAARRVAY
jgi:Isochorismatase family